MTAQRTGTNMSNAWTTHNMTAASQVPDYRSILKRFIAAVIEDDHVVGLTAIDNMDPDERVILVALGLESCRENGDEWMCSNLEGLIK